MDDILNDLIIADGKERPAKKKAAKKAKKKIAKPAKQAVAEPISIKSTFSEADLLTKSTSELKAICLKLGVDVPRRKTDLIKNILDNT